MSKTDSKTVAEKMAELSRLVEWFESDEFELEQAIDRYKQAEALANDIDRDLTNLKNDIHILKTKFDD